MSRSLRTLAATAAAALLASPLAAQQITVSSLSASFGCGAGFTALVGSIGCKANTSNITLSFLASPSALTTPLSIANGSKLKLGDFTLSGKAATTSAVSLSGITFDALLGIAAGSGVSTVGVNSPPVEFTGATAGTVNRFGNTNAGGLTLSFSPVEGFTYAPPTPVGQILVANGTFNLALDPVTLVRTGGNTTTPAASATQTLWLEMSGVTAATFGDAPSNVVPEPASLALMAGGLAAFGVVARRRRVA